MYNQHMMYIGTHDMLSNGTRVHARSSTLSVQKGRHEAHLGPRATDIKNKRDKLVVFGFPPLPPPHPFQPPAGLEIQHVAGRRFFCFFFCFFILIPDFVIDRYVFRVLFLLLIFILSIFMKMVSFFLN
jgi:hypothetical protein